MASFLDPHFKTTLKAERVDYMKSKAAAEIESLVAEQEKTCKWSFHSTSLS